MSTLIQASFILVLFVLVRCSDIAIISAIARSYIRCIAYGIVAILALVYIVFALLGH